MRAHEFIIKEKIEYAQQAIQFYQKFKQQFPAILERIYNENVRSFEFYKSKANPEHYPTPEERLEDQHQIFVLLHDDFVRLILKLLAESGVKNVSTVRFANITALGEWHYDSQNQIGWIQIQVKMYRELAEGILWEFVEHFYDTGYEETIRFRSSLPRVIDEPLTRMLQVIVHEATHARQRGRYRDPATRSNYYSYAVRRERFFELLKQEVYSDEYYRAHRSSPKEIGTYAVETVYQILSELGLNLSESADYLELDEDEHIIRDIMRTMSSGGLSDRYPAKYPEDPMDQRVYRRFYKKVYEELDNVLQYVQHLKSTKPKIEDEPTPRL